MGCNNKPSHPVDTPLPCPSALPNHSVLSQQSRPNEVLSGEGGRQAWRTKFNNLSMQLTPILAKSAYASWSNMKHLEAYSFTHFEDEFVKQEWCRVWEAVKYDNRILKCGICWLFSLIQNVNTRRDQNVYWAVETFHYLSAACIKMLNSSQRQLDHAIWRPENVPESWPLSGMNISIASVHLISGFSEGDDPRVSARFKIGDRGWGSWTWTTTSVKHNEPTIRCF